VHHEYQSHTRNVIGLCSCRTGYPFSAGAGATDFIRRPDAICEAQGKGINTDDGEAIEGEAAEEVEVMGRVTYFINSTDADDIPV